MIVLTAQTNQTVQTNQTAHTALIINSGIIKVNRVKIAVGHANLVTILTIIVQNVKTDIPCN